MTVKKHTIVLGVLLLVSIIYFAAATYFFGLKDRNFWSIYSALIGLPLLGIFIQWYAEAYIHNVKSTKYLLLLSIAGFLMPVLALFIYHRTLPYGSGAECGGGMFVRNCVAGSPMGTGVNDFYSVILLVATSFVATQVLFIILNRVLKLSKNIAAVVCVIAWIILLFYIRVI